jgi:2-keto-myo-inositol isomerase
MLPTLSQVCSLSSPFEKDLEDYAAGHVTSVELWFTKLENYVASHSTKAVRELLDQFGLTAPVVSFQGGLLTSQGDARREAWEQFHKRIALCREIGIGTIVIAGDILPPLDQVGLDRVQTSLVQVAQACGAAGLRAALEFQSTAVFGNNLQTAAALVAEVGSPHLGLCFDVFHYHCGPSKLEDLGYLTRENLFHVQLCDLSDVPRELARDADRILPGDGDLPLAPVVARLREIAYEGPVSVELMNPQLWQVPARQFGEIAITALRRTLGVASMNG